MTPITKNNLKSFGYSSDKDDSMVWHINVDYYKVWVIFAAMTYIMIENSETGSHINFDSCDSMEELSILCKTLQPK